jgi:hypothetical protein
MLNLGWFNWLFLSALMYMLLRVSYIIVVAYLFCGIFFFLSVPSSLCYLNLSNAKMETHFQLFSHQWKCIINKYSSKRFKKGEGGSAWYIDICFPVQKWQDTLEPAIYIDLLNLLLCNFDVNICFWSLSLHIFGFLWYFIFLFKLTFITQLGIWWVLWLVNTLKTL